MYGLRKRKLNRCLGIRERECGDLEGEVIGGERKGWEEGNREEEEG